MTIQNLLHVRDEKSANTAGGTPSSGSNTRVLNVSVTNEISGASLSSNQITLAAGTYSIDASSPAYRADEHRIYLWNVSDSSVTLVGLNNYCWSNSADVGMNQSFVRGRFTISSTKTFELRHEFTSTSGGSNGLGLATNNGQIEVYASVMIREIIDDFPLLHIRDEKTANTDGGASSTGFNTRTLQTIKGTNEITGASLAANVVTLPIGTYEIFISTAIWKGDAGKVLFYNVDDDTYDILGFTQYSRGNANAGHLNFCHGYIAITSEKDFEVHQRINVAISTNGLGRKMNDGMVEVYTEILIRQLLAS